MKISKVIRNVQIPLSFLVLAAIAVLVVGRADFCWSLLVSCWSLLVVLVGAVDPLLVVLVNRRWFCWSLVGRAVLSFQQVNLLFQSGLVELSTTAVGLLVCWSRNITYFGKKKKIAFWPKSFAKKCFAV